VSTRWRGRAPSWRRCPAGGANELLHAGVERDHRHAGSLGPAIVWAELEADRRPILLPRQRVAEAVSGHLLQLLEDELLGLANGRLRREADLDEGRLAVRRDEDTQLHLRAIGHRLALDPLLLLGRDGSQSAAELIAALDPGKGQPRGDAVQPVPQTLEDAGLQAAPARGPPSRSRDRG